METLTEVLEFLRWPGTFLVASILAAAGGWASTYARHRLQHINTPSADVPPVCRRTVRENMGLGWFFGIAFSVAGMVAGYKSVEVIWALSCAGGYLNYETGPPIKAAFAKLIDKVSAKWLS